MNTRTAIAVFVLLLLGLGLASCAGLDLGDLVKVKTPNDIQRAEGLPATTTLNEAESAYAAWFDDVQRAGTEWKANIERGNEVRGLLGQLTLSALDEVGPTIAGLPVLGASVPVATGLAGLLFGAGRLRKEKEASFNKGLERGSIAGSGPTATTPPTPRTPPTAG